MKRIGLFVIGFVVLVSGCSSPPPVTTPSFTVDREIWSGEATEVGQTTGTPQKVFLRLRFSQTGETTEGVLELGPSATALVLDSILTGSLKDHTLNLNATDLSLNGTFATETKVFSGTLTFDIEGVKKDFTSTMSFEKKYP
jgi:Prokaryotic membrane lipoprotein lipid attachment site